jgi:hypothetical protein
MTRQQAREEWMRRITALRLAAVGTSTDEIPDHDAGISHGTDWCNQMIAQSGLNARTTMFLLGVCEGLFRSLHAALDERN